MKKLVLSALLIALGVINSVTAQNHTQQVTAIQYYFNTDPGVGVAGNGAIVPITPTADLNQSFAITIPNTLTGSFQNLYVRAKDEYGRWSIPERRLFYINTIAGSAVQDVIAYQYYFDTDPGVGLAGNGAIVPITQTSNFNQTVAITVPNTLTAGFHNLYIRTKDTGGQWSLIERRVFYINTISGSAAQDVTAYQYYFDTDPGVGLAGNGAIVPITQTSNFNQTVAITVPNSLANGFHNLYVRSKDIGGQWSLMERRLFYIRSGATVTITDVAALEFYYDIDPGVGNANPYAVTTSPNVNITAAFGVPCLSTGTHYLYVRAKNTSGRWSIIEKDTMTVTSGVTAAVVTPSGPLNICAGSSTTLSFTSSPGVTYQWLLNGNDISGATGNSYVVSAAGNYSVKSICGSTFTTSNVVVVSVLPLLTYYADADGDAYGNIAVTVQGCTAPSGYVSNSTDCNDNDNTVHVALQYYIDADLDGFGSNTSAMLCSSTAPSGYSTNHTDCDDDNINIHATVLYYVDADGDGYGSTTSAMLCSLTAPAGYSTNNTDCSDTNASIHASVQYYIDADHDGYGSTATAMVCALTPPVGYSTNSNDCNDTVASIHPGATETCNLLDDDCDGLIDENIGNTYYADADNDGYGNLSITIVSCTLPAGYAANGTDCDDTNASIHPGATETCNQIDDDCDGAVDEGVLLTFYADADNDGWGNAFISQTGCTAPSGYVTLSGDCNDTNAAIHPGVSETCNLIDDNCNGTIDEGVQIAFYADGDNDGFGNPSVVVMACSQPSGFVIDHTDCNDALTSVHPGAVEMCNGYDDDCDGQVDEGFSLSVAASSITSSAGNSFCSGTSTTLSVSGGSLGSGGNWVWYEGGCGTGSSMGTGDNLVITPSAGNHTYYVRAEGSCNTSGCASKAITVNSSPTFTTCPSAKTVGNTTSSCSAVATYTVAATGSPSPTLTYSFTGATVGSGSGTGSGSTFNHGVTAVLVTATNSCGNSNCSFNVTVNDTHGPQFIGCPTPITSDAESGQWGAHVSWTEPTATDNCAFQSMTSSHSPGAFFNVGSTVVTYTAEDESGNTTICQFIVSVTPPDLVGKTNASIFTTGIHFSNDNPDVNSTVNVSVSVSNNSNLTAGNFHVKLVDLFSNTTYAVANIASLEAGQSIQLNWVVNTPTIDAFVPIQITVDALNELDESNESDNVAIRPFVCGDPNILGTINVAANAIPSTAPAGATIQLCGSAFYADTDPPLADPSVAGAEIKITVVETGEIKTGHTNENGNFCISYHTANTPRLYHFTVEITDNVLGGEASGTFTLTTPPPPPCYKDLFVSMELTGIESLADPKYTVPVGTTFSAIVHVKNSCQAVTQATTLFISLSLGTPVPGPYVIPALAPGQIYNVTLPLMTLNTVGTSYISATVDYYNTVVEQFETNNTAYVFFKVLPALPDLVAGRGSVLSHLLCKPGNEVVFGVGNNGMVAAYNFNAIFDFYENNVLQQTQTVIVPSLLPGKNISLAFPISLVTASDSFALRVDDPNIIEELFETNNNSGFHYVFEDCKADLVVLGCDYLDVKPANPSPGQSLQVKALIENIGQLPVTTPFNVEFNIAGSIVSVPVNTSLSSGDVITVTASAPAPSLPGQYVSVTADASNVIVEEYEGSTYSAPLNFDFEFAILNCAGEPFFHGTQYYCSPANMTIGLWNFGVYEADGFETKFEVSGPGLSGWVDLGTVSQYEGNSCGCPGGVHYPNAFYFPQTGNYSLRVTLDPNNEFAETNESNNVSIYAMNVVESVEYRIFSSYITPSDLNPDLNESITFDVSYENFGCAGFNPIELYADIDEIAFDSTMVPALPAGGIASYSFPNSWSSSVPGLHVFRAIVDHDEQMTESNEINNEATRAVVVGEAPDFNVMSVTSSDVSPSFGEIIQLTSTIHNDGASTGSGTFQLFYDDGNGPTL
ncbi:MAG: CARDB domain-containing protein, partial [Saprospiraceae bacterium]